MIDQNAIPVTPAQARQLSLEVAAYQAHFVLHDLLGDVWRDLDVSAELERDLAQRLVDAAAHDLQPIEAKIKTVADAGEHVHAIAPVIGAALRQITSLSLTSIHLSTNALAAYWIPMITEDN
ncbi:MAG: hypothetical protein OXG68_02285 [Chloroflexi bacterium]|nr:hypothetical protein [Chloroflexota bacterium]